MINLSDLKLDEIIKTFDIDINGDAQEVVILNLLVEEREKLKDKMIDLSQKLFEGKGIIEEIYIDMLIYI